MPQLERTEDGQAAEEAVAASLRGKKRERVAYTDDKIGWLEDAVSTHR